MPSRSSGCPARTGAGVVRLPALRRRAAFADAGRLLHADRSRRAGGGRGGGHADRAEPAGHRGPALTPRAGRRTPGARARRTAPRLLLRRVHHRGGRAAGRAAGGLPLDVGGFLPGAFPGGAYWSRTSSSWTTATSFTASGSASALDLGLHVVRRDHGAEIANAVSRRLVFAAHGTEVSGSSWSGRCPTCRTSRSVRCSRGRRNGWASRCRRWRTLAAHAAVFPATLHRRFRTQLGTTPLAWLTGERVAVTCRLIERGEERLDVVAERSGLGTAANLRARLRRETGLSPSAYRRRFGPAPGEAMTPGPFGDQGAGRGFSCLRRTEGDRAVKWPRCRPACPRPVTPRLRRG